MLTNLTIAQAHQKLLAKEISATELTQAYFNQIDQTNDQLNSVVYKNTDLALERAKKIDALGDFSNRLSGVPFLVKDVFCEKGIATTACSNMLRSKDYKPPFSATTIKRLEAVGAISLGKVNTDEFTMGASTETSCYGVTKNPWDTSRVAGGSSGGSAASVAANQCTFALGTDTGGSIRQPAAFCGCTGLRSTYGLTSRYGVMSMASSLDTIGALTKTVEDTAIVLQAIAGKDPLDGTTGRNPVPNYTASLDTPLAGRTIGIPQEYMSGDLNSEVAESIHAAKKVLLAQGANVVDISLPHTKYAVATYYVICPSEVSSNMARYDGIRFGHKQADTNDLLEYYKQNRSSGFGKEVTRRIMIGAYALSAGYYDAYYRQAQRVRALIKQDFDTAFEQVDAIMSPCTPSGAFSIGANNDDPLAMYLEDIFLSSQALAGIPAMSVPCGFTKQKLPLGLQIMGPQWGEEVVLNIGHQYQLATDWHTKSAPIS